MVSTHSWAALGLIFNALVWGLSWWPLRELQALGVHPLWATAFIFGVAWLGLQLTGRVPWPQLLRDPWMWCLMLAAGLTNAGFNWAVTTGDVVRVVLLFYVMPAWSVGLSWLLLREVPSWADLSRLVLAMVGVVVVLKEPGVAWPIPQNLADWLGLGAGFCFALTNVTLRKLRDAPDRARVSAMFVGGAASALVLALVMSLQLFSSTPVSTDTAPNSVPWPPALDAAWLGYVVALAVLFWLSNQALQLGATRLPPHITALLMLTEVVFASVSSVWLGAAEWSTHTWVGASLIVVASVWAAGGTRSTTEVRPRSKAS